MARVLHPAPVGIREITVVVPAHDEAELIGACLASLDVAAAAVPVPVHVVVVADACTDRTLEAVGPDRDVVVVAARNVGVARAAGFLGADRRPGSWYATTDADSRVPADWLVVQLESAIRHDVFVGTVEVTDWLRRATGLETEYRRHYSPSTGHRHVHGTSLALSAESYWSVGGFAAVAAHEDVALIESCVAAGYAVDWSASAPVATSARHSERTPHGFASYLSALEETLPA